MLVLKIINVSPENVSHLFELRGQFLQAWIDGSILNQVLISIVLLTQHLQGRKALLKKLV